VAYLGINNREAGELLKRTVQFYISDYFLQANTFRFFNVIYLRVLYVID